MIIDGKKLADTVIQQAAEDIKQGIASGKQPPKLVVFTVQPTQESQAYIRIKRKRLEEIGALCQIVHYEDVPPFETLVGRLAEVAQDPSTSSVIVQLPLPAGLGTTTLLNYIPDSKEVEGFKKKSPFLPPIGLAVLTMLKSVFTPVDETSTIVNLATDGEFFRNTMRRKKVVVIGNGVTGGQPVGVTLSKFRISYINIDINTPKPEEYLEQADIIISCVGKTVVKAEHVKQGAVLVSVGLHMENGKWVGDYNEKAIEGKALAYSPTPGGVGPVNVAYLLHNTVQAWKNE